MLSQSAKLASLLFLCLTGVFLIGLQWKPWGWLMLLVGSLFLLLTKRQFAKYVLLAYISVAILGATPINTDISWGHAVFMGLTLLTALLVPYAVSRHVWKDKILQFKFHHGRNWYKKEVAYIFITAALAYLLLPFYLRDTGSYLNWTVEPGTGNIIRFFIGTNALGIWDELFFISILLGIFRQFMPFTLANLSQATLFTSFLYELGFRGWGPLPIFIFALTQGYIFKKTESLLYIITIHLTLDLVLFLALLDAHHPGWVPIFVT